MTNEIMQQLLDLTEQWEDDLALAQTLRLRNKTKDSKK